MKEEEPGADWVLSASWRNAKRVSCCNVVFCGYDGGFQVHTLLGLVALSREAKQRKTDWVFKS